MFRKMIAAALLVAVTGLPAILAGCAEEDEIHIERHTEVKDAVVDQHEVVE